MILNSNFIHKFKCLVEHSYFLNNLSLEEINNIIMLTCPHVNNDFLKTLLFSEAPPSGLI